MRQGPRLDGKRPTEASARRCQPIGCWVAGVTAGEISGTVWDDDHLLVGARLRRAFGALVRLDEEAPAYVVQLANVEIEISVHRYDRRNAVVRVAPVDRPLGNAWTVRRLPLADASGPRLSAAVRAVARTARDELSGGAIRRRAAAS